ncbi:unnamed protein product [Durusdinium trenchii]|uniref:Uncharacterized protein n=1 Tax=Durusdinium trenchii TaxID=1381693 RepID=A0ABP0JBP0_9DINO
MEVPRRRTTPQASAALAAQLPQAQMMAKRKRVCRCLLHIILKRRKSCSFKTCPARSRMDWTCKQFPVWEIALDHWQVDLSFMDTPMLEMPDAELRVTFFFAALEEWLESRFMRLADIVAQRLPWSLEELEETSGEKAQRFPEKKARRSAIAPKDEASAPTSPSGERRVLARQETRKDLKGKDDERNPKSREAEKKEKNMKSREDERKEKREREVKERGDLRERKLQLAPWLTLSTLVASGLLRPRAKGI